MNTPVLAQPCPECGSPVAAQGMCARCLLEGAAAATEPVDSRVKILRRDAAKARLAPGVHAVLLAEDIPGENNTGPVRHDEPLLATDEEQGAILRIEPATTH